MDSDQFFTFLNQTSSWPQSQNQLDELLKRGGDYFGATFTALLLEDSKTNFAVGIADSSEKISRERILNFLKNDLKILFGSENKLEQVQASSNSSEFLHWPISSPDQTFLKIPFHLTPQGQKKPGGTLIIGSASPPSGENKMKAVAFSQKLSELLTRFELESDIQIRSQFLSIASHELKTPLTSIYGILQLQERLLRPKADEGPAFPDQERHHNFLKMVIRQVERLNELIDGLLDVSRIQNGRFTIEPTETDVAALTNDCIQGRLAHISSEAGVKLQLDSVDQLVAWVDPIRMEEVITNLVMNAIRFSPEGGVVWIRLKAEKGSFRLAVRDQGPALPLEDRDRIFKPFERAQRTTRLGGLGLGLFIARQIAQLHGGNVTLIESLPGKGNVFEAYFPVQTLPLREMAPKPLDLS